MIERDITKDLTDMKPGEAIEIKWEEGESIVFEANICGGTIMIEDKKDD